MAHIRACKYCTRDVISSAWHEECRVAFCEDLLAKAKSAIEKQTHGPMQLYHMLREALQGEIFQTMEEYLANIGSPDNLESRKKRWMILRQQASQEFLSDWEKDHPEPNPTDIG